MTSGEGLRRIPLTLSFSATIVLLHLARFTSPLVGRWYGEAAFIPGHMSSPGILLCGFFHQNAAHFAANLISLVPCLALLELAVGTRLAFAALGAGLWLSNPLTALILRPLLSAASAEQLGFFLKEVDYGASNGIYGVIGALAALLRHPRHVIQPFIFNGLIFALLTSSWLAAQHVIALFMGYFISLWLLPRTKVVEVPVGRRPTRTIRAAQ